MVCRICQMRSLRFSGLSVVSCSAASLSYCESDQPVSLMDPIIGVVKADSVGPGSV